MMEETDSIGILCTAGASAGMVLLTPGSVLTF